MPELGVLAFDLHQKRPFKVSYGAYSQQRCVIVRLADQGQQGFGEATVFAAYGVRETILIEALERARKAIRGVAFTTPQALRALYLPLIGHCPFACAAIDAAAWDLYGRIADRPVREMLGLAQAPIPPSAYSIGLEDVEETAHRAAEMRDWPIIKLKLGDQWDIARVRAVRAVTDAVLRVDANGGWSVEETVEKARQLRDLGVESIEQPLPADDWAGMAALKGRSALPIYADEACHSAESFAAALALFDGVTLKTMKLGGITPALDLIARAKAAGRQVALGCMPESTIGVSSTVQIASLADQLDIDSIVLIREDLAEGVRLERGLVRPTALPGLGFEIRFTDEPTQPGRLLHALS